MFPFLNVSNVSLESEKEKEKVPKDGKHNQSKGEPKENKPEEKKSEEVKSDNADESKATEDTFTEEQDAKMLEMKKDNKSWREIAEATGKAQHLLKKRFKEIKPAEPDAKPAKQSHDQSKEDKAAEHKAKGLEEKRKQEEAKAQHAVEVGANVAAAATAHAQAQNEAKMTMEEWRALTTDETFTYSDLQTLALIVNGDTDHRWQRIASRFFDLTGKRIHPEMMKRKFAV